MAASKKSFIESIETGKKAKVTFVTYVDSPKVETVEGVIEKAEKLVDGEGSLLQIDNTLYHIDGEIRRISAITASQIEMLVSQLPRIPILL